MAVIIQKQVKYCLGIMQMTMMKLLLFVIQKFRININILIHEVKKLEVSKQMKYLCQNLKPVKDMEHLVVQLDELVMG